MGQSFLIETGTGLSWPTPDAFYLRAKEICRPKKNFKTRFTIKTGFPSFKALNPGRKLRLFSAPSVWRFRAAYPNVNFDFYEIPSDLRFERPEQQRRSNRTVQPSRLCFLAVYPLWKRKKRLWQSAGRNTLWCKRQHYRHILLADVSLAVPFDCLDLDRSSFGHHLSRRIFLLLPLRMQLRLSGPDPLKPSLASLTAADFQHIRDLTVKHFSDENLFITSAFIVNKSIRCPCGTEFSAISWGWRRGLIKAHSFLITKERNGCQPLRI